MRKTVPARFALAIFVAASAFACSATQPFYAETRGSAGASSGSAGAIDRAGGTADTGGAADTAAGASGHSGGSAAGSGAAGMSGAPPCDGDCKGSTPVCDEATNTCVECLAKGDCKSPKPACDAATNTCVECTATTDCEDRSKPFCDTTAKQCVACLKQSDCTSPAASACSAGTCSACTQDADCSNIAGKGVCQVGTCVQCTTSKESACNGKSCNPTTNACTTTAVNTVDYCLPCVADSECIGGNKADPDARCVPMKFAGAARTGGFCLRRAVKACSKPFTVQFSASSLSGAATEAYCGINQESTRCEAVVDFIAGTSCADGKDTSCGCARDKDGKCSETGQGGLCKTVGGNPQLCTIPCEFGNECKGSLTCPSALSYCQ